MVKLNISRWVGRRPSGGGITRTPRVITRVILIVIVLALGAFVAGRAFNGNEASADEVRLEPILTAGTHPFTPPVGTDKLNMRPPPKVKGLRLGNMPGLFGGEGQQASCNPASLVAFLQTDREKGAAWASVLGIQPNEIESYVAGLTSVILRSDTAVTNHGFRDGQTTTIPAVLQAGTAVLVNKFGKPVVKCYCGNPLSAPLSYSQSRYYGKAWSRFSPTNITVVQEADAVINKFILAHPLTGEPVPRIPGTSGQPVPSKPPPAEQDQLERDQLEQNQLERDQLERSQLERDQLERDQLERDQLERDQLDLVPSEPTSPTSEPTSPEQPASS